MPSRRPGRRQRGRLARRRRAAERDWADGLPVDALLAVFQRLDHIDVLTGVDHVCRSWRRAARDEPSLWRRITMRGHAGIAARLNRCGLTCEAVRRSAGRCEAFCGEYAGDDGFLVYLSERKAPLLKSLRLISCNGITDPGLIEAMRELPLLEELEISLCGNVHNDTLYKIIGEAGLQLKHFYLRKICFNKRDLSYEEDIQGIAAMHELRSLHLFGSSIYNAGLESILDGCLELEYLDIRQCFNVDMDANETLRAKCARIKTLKLPDDPTNDCDMQVGSPLRTYASPPRSLSPCFCQHCPRCSDSDKGDESDSDFYREPPRYEEDLDKYDRLLPYNMRTFLKG